MTTDSRCFGFGPFVLDPARGVLLRDGIRVPLTPRTIELLTVLVSSAPAILNKDELIQRVWGGTVVEENNLARQISSLRKALHEPAGKREYIATVPGVGYRFVAPVSLVSEGTEPVSAAPAAVVWFKQPVFVSIAVALTAIIAIGTTVARRNAGTGKSETVQRSMQQFTFGGGLQQDPAWSPDGKRIAFASDRLGTMDIWIQAVGENEPARITTSAAREWQPAWSPDSQQLVFRSEQDGGGLFVVAAKGGDVRRITDFGDRPSWSPDGRLILFSNATVRTGARRLYVVDPAGGVPREVCAEAIQPFTSNGWLNSVDAAWHPDGRRISIWGRSGAAWAFVTAPIDGGPVVTSVIPDEALHVIDDARLRLGRFVWAPSGDRLYFEGQSGDTRNIWRVKLQPVTLEWTAAPERMTTDVGAETDIALSPDGSHLAFTVRSQKTSVWALDFDYRQGRLTGGELALTSGSSGQVDVDTLPDGSRLAYRALRAGRNEMREFKTASREERVLLVSNEWSPSMPRWSSDGRRLAYARPSTPGRSVVAIMSPDERQEQILSLPGESALRPSDWSADGLTILGDCRTTRSETSAVCTIAAPIGAAPQPPKMNVLVRDAGKNLFGPRFSPDQRWISFLAVDAKGSTTSQVFAVPAGGGAWVPLTDGRSFDDKVRWSPDGRSVYFVSNRNGYLNLYGRKFDPALGVPVGDVFSVTSFDSPRRGLPTNIAQIEFAVSRRRLFLPLTETQADIWVLDRVDR